MGTIVKEGTTQEESTHRDCEETVAAIATAVSLLKNKTSKHGKPKTGESGEERIRAVATT